MKKKILNKLAQMSFATGAKFRLIFINGKHVQCDATTDVNYQPLVDVKNAAGANCYFLPNTAAGNLSNKKRTGDPDITHLNTLFVDVDRPDAGDDIDKFTAQLGIDPSAVIASGNGFHVYYFLAEPLAASEENVKLWKAANEIIIAVLDGDTACNHPGRILRLPATTNYKLDKKNQKNQGDELPCRRRQRHSR